MTDRGAEAKQEDFPGTEGSYRFCRDLALVDAEILTLDRIHPRRKPPSFAEDASSMSAATILGGDLVYER